MDSGTNVSFGFGTICDCVNAKLDEKLKKFSSILRPNCRYVVVFVWKRGNWRILKNCVCMAVNVVEMLPLKEPVE